MKWNETDRDALRAPMTAPCPLGREVNKFYEKTTRIRATPAGSTKSTKKPAEFVKLPQSQKSAGII